MKFIHRVAELSSLTSWWQTPESRPALVWGRRRVGKTALIQHFAQQKRALFYTATGQPAQRELAAFSQAVTAVLPELDARALAAHPYHDWASALEHLAAHAQREPLLVVIDELPELLAATPELPALIRAFLDKQGGASRVKLLLCGSAVRTMNELQNYRAPLYGRFDLLLQVHPFTPHEAALMLPDLPPDEQAVVYGLLDGLPLYLSWWEQTATLRENLSRLFCQPGARLLTEAELILATELEGALSANVLRAIALGKTRHSDIADWVGTEPTRVLERLIELRLIERLLPVTDHEQRSRRRAYRLTDNLLAFYLGVLSRHQAEIERGTGSALLPTIEAAINDHMGPVWEHMVRTHLRRLAAAGQLVDDYVALGPWWRPDGTDEIDVVVLAGRSREPVMVGEAKWATSVNGGRLVHALRRKAAGLVDTPEDLPVVLAARTEVKGAPDDTRIVTATDIMGGLP